MKPPQFDYYRPDNLQEALELLAERGEEGKIVSGGQSLVPILNMRLSAPECLIDINGLKELDDIREEGGVLKIGALCRQRALELSETVKRNVPLLAEAVPFIGHVQTRNRGTAGGSLVHADPTAEIPVALLALDAKAVIRSLEEEREVRVADFFITYLTTDILPHELLTEIRIPLEGMPAGYGFAEFSRRHGDFAIVNAACLLDVDESGRIRQGRLALGGVNAVPVLMDEAIRHLLDKPLTEKLLAEAGEIAAENVDPEGDLHATREYRIHLAKVFAMRAVRLAYERAIAGRRGGDEEGRKK